MARTAHRPHLSPALYRATSPRRTPRPSPRRQGTRAGVIRAHLAEL